MSITNKSIKVRDFKKALLNIHPSKGERKFLLAHLESSHRASTATILAKAGGYSGYRGINLRYGILGKKIADSLGVDGALITIATFIEPKTVSNSDWIIIMREEYAQALEESGWLN